MTPQEALNRINNCSDDLFVLLKAVGLSPEHHLKGGDWRGCSFEGLDLRGLNLTYSRLHDAKFDEATRAANANFHGADLGFRSTLWRARDWRSALLDDDQRHHLEEQEAGATTAAVWKYVRQIKSAQTYDDVVRVYAEMLSAEVVPNAHVFATVIDKIDGDNWNEVQRWRREAESRKIIFDEALFAAMINKAPTYELALEMFKQGKAMTTFRSSYPYNALIAKTPSLREAILLVDEMRTDSVVPDQITLNAAIKDPWMRTVPFDHAMALAQGIIDGGAVIRTSEIGALIRTAASVDQRRRVNALRKNVGLPRDAHVVNATISSEENFKSAWHVYTCDKAQGFRPDKYTFYALLGKCDKFTEMLTILAEMATWKIPFDDDVVRQIVRVTEDKSLRQEHHHEGIERIIREYIWRYTPDREKWIDLIFLPFRRA